MRFVNAKRGAKGAAFVVDCYGSNQLAACAGTSRWCFITILLSAPR
jgi:hypothetical protein